MTTPSSTPASTRFFTTVVASNLHKGDTYCEEGMTAVRITSLGMHGDTVLVRGVDVEYGDRIETTLDRDTVVELITEPVARPRNEALATRVGYAKARLEAAYRHMEALLLEQIQATVLAAFPTAHTLQVEGCYSEDGGFIVRARGVLDGDGNPIAGEDTPASQGEAWDDFIDDGIDDDLDDLGGLTGDAFAGRTEISITHADTADPPAERTTAS